MQKQNVSPPWWYENKKSSRELIVVGKKKKFGILFFGIIFIVLLIGAAFFTPTEQPRMLKNGAIQNPASLDDLVASCSGYVQWNISDYKQIGWKEDGKKHIYRFFPPTGGTFSVAPAKPGFYSQDSMYVPTIPDAVGNLWRGMIVVWYRAGIPEERLNIVKELAESKVGDVDYVVLPWPKNKISLWDNNRTIMLTGWGLSQACNIASYEVFNNFAELVKQQGAPGVGVPLNQPGKKA
jgi:hypothetical protein